jgi:hypothetical protein
MKTEQKVWMDDKGWEPGLEGNLNNIAQLVLVFSDTINFKKGELFKEIKESYPNAQIVGCSTAGEICGRNVLSESLTLTAIYFENSSIISTKIKIENMEESFSVGEKLVNSLKKEGLRHILVLSDGLNVNGSELVKGMNNNLSGDVSVTGGLSADGEKFIKTYVIFNGEPEEKTIVAVGFYGDHLKIGYGSMGGWDSFGVERLVTRSKSSVLYELDGKPVLELYKTYLGDQAAGLPATGLLFPLGIRTKDSDKEVVRTILSMNEKEQSFTFAGDVPVGSIARLMKANFDRLIDGAVGAAEITHKSLNSVIPDLAILISCVGRKLVLKQRVEEEVEGVSEILGKKTIITGFYSYGEISPFKVGESCELHNQTMTITTFLEI